MIVTARLEFELTYYDSTGQRFKHYNTAYPTYLSIGGWLVDFYGITTVVGYLMLNPVYISTW